MINRFLMVMFLLTACGPPKAVLNESGTGFRWLPYLVKGVMQVESNLPESGMGLLIRNCEKDIFNGFIFEKTGVILANAGNSGSALEIEQEKSSSSLVLKNRHSNLYRWLFITSSVFLALTLGFVYFYQRSKERFRKQLNEQEVQYRIRLDRERISRELHDHVGSQLTFLIKRIEKLDQETMNKEDLDCLAIVSQQVIRDLREAIWVVNKDSVQLQELKARIEQLVWRAGFDNAECTYHMNFQFQTNRLLHPVHALNAFRIIQESIHNTVKHSRAKNVYLRFAEEEDQMQIVIHDDGVGFDMNRQEHSSQSYGLKIMQKRAVEIGGILDLTTHTGGGVQVAFNLPFDC